MAGEATSHPKPWGRLQERQMDPPCSCSRTHQPYNQGNSLLLQGAGC